MITIDHFRSLRHTLTSHRHASSSLPITSTHFSINTLLAMHILLTASEKHHSDHCRLLQLKWLRVVRKQSEAVQSVYKSIFNMHILLTTSEIHHSEHCMLLQLKWLQAVCKLSASCPKLPKVFTGRAAGEAPKTSVGCVWSITLAYL